MDKGPFEKLLNRELMKAHNKEKIDRQSPALRQLVDYATSAFARCWQSRQDTGYHHNGFFLLYRHVLEMADAIQVLISESCFGPSIPLVRSSFEAVLSMEFISEDDFERRSIALLTYYFHRQLDQCESLDPTTERGKNLIRSIRNDRFAPFIPPEMQSNYEKESSELLKLLQTEEFAQSSSRLKQLKQNRKLRFWSQLCDTGEKKVSAVWQLADHLKRTAEYELLYRGWSEVSHARNFSRLLIEDQDGQQFHERMRSSNVYQDPGVSEVTYIHQALGLLLAKYQPSEIELYEDWFDKMIRSKLLTG